MSDRKSRSALRHVAGGGALALIVSLGAAPALADSPARVDTSMPTPSPVYSAAAQINHEEGKTIVGVLVSDGGRPLRLRVEGSSGFADLDNAAVQAVANWHFIPAIKNGDTATAWAHVEVQFKMPEVVQNAPPAATDKH